VKKKRKHIVKIFNIKIMYTITIIAIIVAAYFAAKGINSANDITKY
jgi:hypothetical protein